ncbi:uncharacterized protein L3040_004463 [Drepanopeziza brunnea f. sp. 'multigermtubi']|uniref:uncharacterized protein n=1 Tax=Drepanopeziza brunnea f. sp. 'multigermtubi' TaxID=698441 RepID=UPI00239A9A10|nr:hypothetical protein L3040_004463 [Drepanopeziza brunnea f. sp. 'multigermtubi']
MHASVPLTETVDLNSSSLFNHGMQGPPSLDFGTCNFSVDISRSGVVNAMARAVDDWIPRLYRAENRERNCTA